MKRVEVESEEEVDEVLLLKGIINDQTEQCEIDTGAQMCMIPERLAAGLQVIDKRSCHPVGPEFMASVVKVKLRVGPIDRVVKATVTPNSFCPYPLVGSNIGLDNLLECARLAKAAYDVADPIKQHAVQTRAQSKKELKLELQAAETRREEHPLIKKPEEVCQLVATTNENSETRLTTPPEAEGGSVSEPRPETEDTASAEGNGERTVAKVNCEVDGDLNVGLIIPSVELGASLSAEYCGDLAKDESLKEWKSWADERKNGFMWDRRGVWKMKSGAAGSC